MSSEGLYGFPTKHVMILVMTGTGWGVQDWKILEDQSDFEVLNCSEVVCRRSLYNSMCQKKS